MPAGLPACLADPDPAPCVPDGRELALRLLEGSCALLPRARSAAREVASLLAPHLDGRRVEVAGDVRAGDDVVGVRAVLAGPRTDLRRAGFEVVSGTVLSVGDGARRMLEIAQDDGGTLRVASTTLCAYPVLVRRLTVPESKVSPSLS